MKILKEGNVTVECTGKGNNNVGCGALLVLEKGDVFKTYHHARFETRTFYTIKCKSCSAKTDVGAKYAHLLGSNPDNQSSVR